MTALQLLADPLVRAALRQAWIDSNPGPTGGHEEGGFILRDSAGKITVSRWPKGSNDLIFLPPHHGCRIGGRDIVATFHTHPNTGADFDPDPSETDQLMVAIDPDLKAKFYVGEFVISAARIYLLEPDGTVSDIASTKQVVRRTRR